MNNDKYILVVDDSATQRATLEFFLNDSGYKVLQGADGNEGLEKLKEIKEKSLNLVLIISDIHMEGMDGLTFVSEVRKDDTFNVLPIIMLTTEGDDNWKQKGKSAGASGWIVKPFDPSKLLKMVNMFVP